MQHDFIMRSKMSEIKKQNGYNKKQNRQKISAKKKSKMGKRKSKFGQGLIMWWFLMIGTSSINKFVGCLPLASDTMLH